MPGGAAMTAPALAPEALAEADDLALDHALFRLFGLHAEADAEDRPELHDCIVAVIGEQAKRLSVWLESRGA